MLKRIERFLPRQPQDRKVLIARDYDESEYELVGALVRETITLTNWDLISCDAPWEKPESEWPEWLVECHGTFNSSPTELTSEQADWLCKNAPGLISMYFRRYSDEPEMAFTIHDADSVYFEVRLSQISTVTSLSSYRELDRRRSWEIGEHRKFFQRPEPLPEGLLDY